MFAAEQAKGWPSGVYLTPATPPKAKPPSPAAGGRREPGGLKVGFVVAAENTRGRYDPGAAHGGRPALSTALADLAALPAGAYERDVASGTC